MVSLNFRWEDYWEVKCLWPEKPFIFFFFLYLHVNCQSIKISNECVEWSVFDLKGQSYVPLHILLTLFKWYILFSSICMCIIFIHLVTCIQFDFSSYFMLLLLYCSCEAVYCVSLFSRKVHMQHSLGIGCFYSLPIVVHFRTRVYHCLWTRRRRIVRDCKKFKRISSTDQRIYCPYYNCCK